MSKTNYQELYDKKNFKVGCHLDNSSFSAETCNKETIEFAQQLGFDGDMDFLPVEEDADYPQMLSEMADEAVDYLNTLEHRTGLSWVFEDNSLFLSPCIENVKEDVEFVSTKKQQAPDEDFRGEWLEVNDHGNCTLYIRGEDGQDTEIWSCV